MKRLLNRRKAIQIASAMVALPLAGGSRSQSLGSRPIRIVTGFAPGALSDIVARAYGEHLQKVLGEAVIVESRPGAGGNLAAMEVKRSAPDGYTFMLGLATQLAGHKVLFKNPVYEPTRDFTKIACFPTGNLPLVVQSSMGVEDIEGFAAYARKHPVGIGTPGAGSYSHVATVELGKHLGVKLEPVHYRGESPALTDFLGGNLPAVNATWTISKDMIGSGKGRAIAVAARKRIGKLPNVRTFAEQGVTSPVFTMTPYMAMVAPAGMPEAMANRYSELFVEAGKTERVRQMNDLYGIDDPAQGRAVFQKLYDAEAPIWAELVASLGIPPA